MAYGLRQMTPQESWTSALMDARQHFSEEPEARHVAGNAIDVWQQYMKKYREHDRRRRAIEGGK